jgi:hypothetical protein
MTLANRIPARAPRRLHEPSLDTSVHAADEMVSRRFGTAILVAAEAASAVPTRLRPRSLAPTGSEADPAEGPARIQIP